MSGRVVYTGSGSGFITVKRPRTNADLEYEKWHRQKAIDEQRWPGITKARDLDTAILKAIWEQCTSTMNQHPGVSDMAVKQALEERGQGYICHD